MFLTPCFHPAVSWRQTAQEQKAAVRGVASVLRHLLTGSLMVALDFLVFWMLDQVRHLVEKDVVARGQVFMCDGFSAVMLVKMTEGKDVSCSPGGGDGAGGWDWILVGHLQGPGGILRPAAGRKNHRHQQEVSSAAIPAGPCFLLHPG